MAVIMKLFLVCLMMMVFTIIRFIYDFILHHLNKYRQKRRRQLLRCYQTPSRLPVLKSGIASHLFLEMDNYTLKRHIRLTREKFEEFTDFLRQSGLTESNLSVGGAARVPIEKKSLLFLWYMANNETFRELSDKFDVAESTAHSIVCTILKNISNLSRQNIVWPDQHQKEVNARKFNSCYFDNVIGAIDGCHIRIQKPRRRGDDYLNRKGYYSILLQGICDHSGRFTDIFVGPPGRVHDSRMLRNSPFFNNYHAKMGDMKLLGDSAYISNDFPFIITPKRDNGILTLNDRAKNTAISRKRVIIENTFGRLKCRFRRLRDLLNYKIDVTVQLIVAGCTLHNILSDSIHCEDHPDGCPRENDDND